MLSTDSLRKLILAVCLLAATMARGAVPSDQQIELRTATGIIAGSLMMPDRGGTLPVVLIIAGSGPTDRNGNTPLLPGANNSLLMLARGLAAAGIASVRYDKRGIASSRPAALKEEDLRFDHLVDDAAAWVSMLGADPRFTSVSIAGHSEGSLVGMAAAAKGKAHAFVSLAGGGRTLSDIMRVQLAGKLAPTMAGQFEQVLLALEAGKTVAQTAPELAGLIRPSVQPYLISVLKYRPVEQIAKLTIPVLIVQGSTDLQVGLDDADALKKARPDAQLLIVPGMNHLLKAVGGNGQEQQASYSDPGLALAPALMPAVVDFLRQAK
jgi:pimeloyl-ACP methyl ester carboxylesterase